MTTIEIAVFIFWVCLGAVVYIYAGYPLLVSLLGGFAARRVGKGPHQPAVTILIAAYNESAVVGRTLENKLNLDYPRDRIEVIVVSDASNDGTDDIVARVADSDPRVRLIRQEPRAGKTAALNRAVLQASGDILVFSDANSLYAPDALTRLVANFNDSSVGYVSGKMVYVNPDGSMIGDGCSAYMKYENFLRAAETRLGSIVGVDGGIDAVRKSLYRPMRADQLPDFVLPLAVAEQGYRVVYEPEALLREDALRAARDEFRMRVRVSLRALWALRDMRHLLNPFRYGWFAWQLVSHKLLRYLAFVFMAGAYAANLVLAFTGSVWLWLFVAENLLLAAALHGYWADRSGRPARVTYIPYYFALVNAAAGVALVRFLRGEKQVIWQPRTGGS